MTSTSSLGVVVGVVVAVLVAMRRGMAVLVGVRVLLVRVSVLLLPMPVVMCCSCSGGGVVFGEGAHVGDVVYGEASVRHLAMPSPSSHPSMMPMREGMAVRHRRMGK